MEGPLTLNELNDVLLTTVSIIVVVPATFKLPMILTWFKVDWPDTFNDDNNVDELDTNKLVKLVLLYKLVVVLYKLLIDNAVDVVKVENVVVSTYPDKSMHNSGYNI